MQDDGSWNAREPVLPTTDLRQVLAVIGVGQLDSDSWSSVSAALESRACTTAGHLETRSRQELLTLLRTLELKKAPQSYLDVLLQVTGMSLMDDRHTGGNMMGRCSKGQLADGFNMRKYTPDIRCFDGIPRKDESQWLDKPEWDLLQDLLVLEAHANDNECLGDYLPDGMAKVYAKLHRNNFALPKPPHASMPGLKGAKPAPSLESMYRHRWQNGRQATYKRIVLDKKFALHIGPKMRRGMTFVPADDERLMDNVRNAAMQHFVDVYEGRVEVSTLPARCTLPAHPHTASHAQSPMLTPHLWHARRKLCSHVALTPPNRLGRRTPSRPRRRRRP